MSEPAAPLPGSTTSWLQIFGSPGVGEWLGSKVLSLAFTSRGLGKLILVGAQESGEFTINERTYPGCGPLFGDDQTLFLNSGYQIWQLENVLRGGARLQRI